MILKDNCKKAKAIVEHVIYEQFGKGNFSLYEQCIARDVRCHLPASWQEIHTINLLNRRCVKKIDEEYAQAFAIKKVEIADLIIGEDKICTRWAIEGVHVADFFKLKATQHRFSLTGQTLYQFNGQEQIAAVWQAWDLLGLLSQITELLPLPKGSKNLDDFLRKAQSLSLQERACMRHLLEGKTAKETALQMKISFRTVEYYFENIKDKLTCLRKKDLFACARLLDKHHQL